MAFGIPMALVDFLWTSSTPSMWVTSWMTLTSSSTMQSLVDVSSFPTPTWTSTTMAFVIPMALMDFLWMSSTPSMWVTSWMTLTEGFPAVSLVGVSSLLTSTTSTSTTPCLSSMSLLTCSSGQCLAALPPHVMQMADVNSVTGLTSSTSSTTTWCLDWWGDGWSSTTSTTHVEVPDMAAELPLSALVVEPDNSSLLVQLQTGAHEQVNIAPEEVVVLHSLHHLGESSVRHLLLDIVTSTVREIRSKMSLAYAPGLRGAVYHHLRLIQLIVDALASYRESLLRQIPIGEGEPRTAPPRNSGEFRSLHAWADEECGRDSGIRGGHA
ncbi:unnamed protein product [Symbiodinium sp. CCMP2592]|nr:unnamed protein product [Symbiodinium sp. CCMP2592]